jgi:hypothetical protein
MQRFPERFALKSPRESWEGKESDLRVERQGFVTQGAMSDAQRSALRPAS